MTTLFEDLDRKREVSITSPSNLVNLFPGITVSQVEKYSKCKAKDFLPNPDIYIDLNPDDKKASNLYPIIDGDAYSIKKGQPPREWQIEALIEWIKRDHRGVIEAITGTGKTFFAVYAISIALRSDKKVLVIVPTIDLFDQWYSLLSTVFAGISIGKLGNGNKNTLASSSILISTVNSAASIGNLADDKDVLVVADECHNYGGDVFSLALVENYKWRLGLSATVGKLDTSYFRNVIYKVSYKEALTSNSISTFEIEFHRISLKDKEREEYDKVSSQLAHAEQKLCQYLKCPPAALFARISKLTEVSEVLAILKGRFLYLSSAQKNILSVSQSKFDYLESLIPTFADKEKILVFTQTVRSAQKASDILATNGLVSRAIHAKVPIKQRRELLSQFKNGKIQVICAPRVLDEGVDIPDVDTAFVLSASRSQRQMVQRLGRIIRVGEGKHSKLVILVFEDTIEDPSCGGYGSFIREVKKVARVRFIDRTQLQDH
jgi:RNA polymerase primary sigma factor